MVSQERQMSVSLFLLCCTDLTDKAGITCPVDVPLMCCSGLCSCATVLCMKSLMKNASCRNWNQGGTMLTRSQADVLCESICKEMPGLDVKIRPEVVPYRGNYYVAIFREGKPYFVVRSEQQWQERRYLLRWI